MKPLAVKTTKTADEETAHSDVNDNDDGEALVQQVLQGHPPPEVGLREEWQAHIGWHRKEDIRKENHDSQGFLLRGGSVETTNQLPVVAAESTSATTRHQDPSSVGSTEATIVAYLAVFLGGVALMLLVLLGGLWMHHRWTTTTTIRKSSSASFSHGKNR